MPDAGENVSPTLRRLLSARLHETMFQETAPRNIDYSSDNTLQTWLTSRGWIVENISGTITIHRSHYERVIQNGIPTGVLRGIRTTVEIGQIADESGSEIINSSREAILVGAFSILGRLKPSDRTTRDDAETLTPELRRRRLAGQLTRTPVDDSVTD